MIQSCATLDDEAAGFEDSGDDGCRAETSTKTGRRKQKSADGIVDPFDSSKFLDYKSPEESSFEDEVDETFLLGIPLELRKNDTPYQSDVTPIRGLGESSYRRKTNKAVDALIGQANVLYARGEKAQARILLLEAIREEPRNPDPYKQVSDIYREVDKLHECLQYGLLAAHLSSRTTAAEWSELGDLACKLGRNEEAAACYGRAIRIEPTDWTYYEKRIILLDQIGLRPLAMRTRLQAAQQIDHSTANLDFSWFQALIKSVAEYYIECNVESRAIEALEAFVLRSREFGKDAEAQHHTLVGMWMSKGRFEDAAKSIFALCQGITALDDNGKFIFEIKYDNAGYTIKPFPPAKVHKYVIGDSLGTYLLARLIVCFIRMDRSDLIPGLVEKLNERQPTADDEESYLLIPQAHMTKEHFVPAQKFLEHLFHYEIFSGSAEAYYLYGQVLESRKKLKDAAVALQRVLDLQPSHVDARIKLSRIQQRLGLTEQAFETLRDYDLDAGSSIPVRTEFVQIINAVKDERLLVRQADFLLSEKRTNQFVRCVRMLLAPHFFLVHRNSTSVKKRSSEPLISNCVRTVALNVLHGSQLEKYVKRLGNLALAEERSLTGLTSIQIHDYCFKLLEIFLNQDRFLDALHICCYAYLQPVVYKTRKTMETFENLLLYCSLKAKEWPLAFEYLRCYFTKCVNNHPLLVPTNSSFLFTRIFNSMNFVFCHSQNVSYHRYIMRALARLPDGPMFGKKSLVRTALRVISGNNSLITGAYRHALSEYLRVWSDSPDNPLVCLLVALTFVHMACKKDIYSRHMIALRISRVLRGLAFMKRYEKLRGPCQETYYNVARMFHQMNILPVAIHFYNKCLQEEIPQVQITDFDTGTLIKVKAERYNLRPMAAHNLALIYRESGNISKATMLLKKYCAVALADFQEKPN
ncbi:unnamed protein product [Enterobius vermicularis]|uniref:TPR_REGION domain-containing protein n=1 Tax=Enterobius vermicularis TaxID=51028 RepID=A0A0N4VJM9_ENTVE|nr:unnamed protein product [Enterobius vermicularis]